VQDGREQVKHTDAPAKRNNYGPRPVDPCPEAEVVHQEGKYAQLESKEWQGRCQNHQAENDGRYLSPVERLSGGFSCRPCAFLQKPQDDENHQENAKHRGKETGSRAQVVPEPEAQ